MADLSDLHIVVVPSWWPSAEQPLRGVFFTDYVRAFADAGAKVGVVVPDLVSLRLLRSRFSTKKNSVLSNMELPLRPKLISEAVDGVPVLRIRGLHTSFGMIGRQMRAYRRWLARGLNAYRAKSGEPDVLIAFAALPAGWACTHLEEPLEERVILSEHTGPLSSVMTAATGEAFVRAAMAQAAKVVTVSQTSRLDIQAHGIDREILVCGNPVAREFTERSVAPHMGGSPIRALFVGRMVAEKGVLELAQAATRLGKASGVEWHFVGDGPAAEDVRRHFGLAGHTSNLRIHGSCDRARVAQLMSESDFLALPSRGETFGQAAAEALCMGLPVLTTRGTACQEFVGAEDGVLVNMNDQDSLLAGLTRLIRELDSFDRRAIAQRARARFNGQKVAAQYGEWCRAIVRR